MVEEAVGNALNYPYGQYEGEQEILDFSDCQRRKPKSLTNTAPCSVLDFHTLLHKLNDHIETTIFLIKLRRRVNVLSHAAGCVIFLTLLDLTISEKVLYSMSLHDSRSVGTFSKQACESVLFEI